MTIKYSGDNITFSDSSIQSTAATGFGFKNRIINGAMMIDQRNAGASVTPSTTASFVYTVDRFAYNQSAASKFAFQQNAGAVTPPAGFSNYLGFTSQSAYSVSAGDYFYAVQRIEANNVSDLGWGTANAATITLSFWVRSSLTGTFGGTLTNNAGNRYYIFSYSIPSANTWTQISVTIPGDTSGTWVTSGNSTGIEVRWGLGSGSTYTGTAGSWSGTTYLQPTGSVNVVGTNGATFYITGVDLRKGSVGAYSNGQNDFDYRPYSTELALCQRYCQVLRSSAYTKFGLGICNNSTTVYAVTIPPKVPFRASPSISVTACYCNDGLSNLGPVSAVNNLSSADGIAFDATIPSGGTQFRPITFGDAGTSTAVITATAEL